MKVLLMGGSGILSSEICALALNRGIEVTIANRGKRKNKIDKRAKLVVVDLKQETVESIRKMLVPEGYDVVVDFVTYNCAQMKRSMQIVGGICKKFVFISTATAYLDRNDGLPFDENTAVGDTGWQYAAEKINCELFLMRDANRYGFEYTIVRPYVTYGETRIPYQVCPIQYYTLINRILCGKPIPVFGKNIHCTLTLSSEFAVGMVGLFLNEQAFGEAFHITGNCVMTWNEVIHVIAEKLNRTVTVIELPIDLLREGNRKVGIDTAEIMFDKGREMVFNNTKIRNIVKDFSGNTMFSEGITTTLRYFKENIEVQVIDYAWDARIDNLLEKSKLITDKKTINIGAYGDMILKEDRRIYSRNRKNISYMLYKVFKKVHIKA